MANAILQPEVREVLSQKLTMDELKALNEFVSRGFTINATTYISAIFLKAKERGRNLSEIVAALEAEWEKSWKLQKSDARGCDVHVLNKLHAEI